MTPRFHPAAALLLTLGMVLAPDVESSEGRDGLIELEAHFLEHGLESLPGRESMRLEDAVVGLFQGKPGANDEKPFVLVTSSPPAGAAPLKALVVAGREGFEIGGLAVPPLFESLGRRVIVAYLEDADGHGEGVLPLDAVAASLDLSALSAGEGTAVRIESAGSSPIWMRLIEQANIPLGLDVRIDEAPDLSSPRATAVYGRQIPGLQFSAVEDASAEEPDAAFGIAPLLAGAIAAKVSRLDEPPPFQRVERAGAEKPTSRRPYTGTIPAYTAEVEGLLLEGVLPGGPAEKAGLEAGDVIVEMAGIAIPDVYAYSDALDSLELDVPVSVVFIRAGERRQTTLIPRARE